MRGSKHSFIRPCPSFDRERLPLMWHQPEGLSADVLARIAHHSAKRVADLLLWNWQPANRIAPLPEPGSSPKTRPLEREQRAPLRRQDNPRLYDLARGTRPISRHARAASALWLRPIPAVN
jgi:hypothetical protein